MAGEDEKGKGKARAAAEGPPKLDRRDLLMGLSTVPALGLFGYAWNKQRQFQQTRAEAAAAPPKAPADLQEVNVALIGAGAQGQVLTEAMLRIPGLRFRAVCDIWTEYNQKRVVNTLKRFKHEVNGYEDYREMLDKEKAIDVVMIASIVPTFPAHIVTQKSVTDIKQLKGKTGGVGRAGTTTEIGMRLGLSRLGIDPNNDVKLVPVGATADALAALSKGLVQFSILFEPFVREAEKLGFKSLVDISSLNIPFHWNGALTRPRSGQRGR